MGTVRVRPWLIQTSVSFRVQQCSLMLFQSSLKLAIGVNQTLHGVIVRSWIFGLHVSLYATRRAVTSIGKFADEFVA
jgi:hypothetical protein